MKTIFIVQGKNCSGVWQTLERGETLEAATLELQQFWLHSDIKEYRIIEVQSKVVYRFKA